YFAPDRIVRTTRSGRLRLQQRGEPTPVERDTGNGSRRPASAIPDRRRARAFASASVLIAILALAHAPRAAAIPGGARTDRSAAAGSGPAVSGAPTSRDASSPSAASAPSRDVHGSAGGRG